MEGDKLKILTGNEILEWLNPPNRTTTDNVEREPSGRINQASFDRAAKVATPGYQYGVS
jgi:hypothetical protein